MIFINNENIVEIAERDSGRDEMNLAEYPFALLYTKNIKSETVIEHNWESPHPVKKGEIIKCGWRVAGDPELGLPRPGDERVYLVLMAITAEQGMSQTVNFTLNDLLDRLGWSHGSSGRKVVMDALNRLMSVTITATNCFYDFKTRSTVTAGFHILSSYKIYKEQTRRKQNELPLSYFKWDDDFFRSLQSNYVKKLNVNFALSLTLPLSVRLYRYLDKKKHGGKVPLKFYREGLQNICAKHLGMTANPYESKLKERMKNAHEELIERGFLSAVEYAAMKSKHGSMVIYYFEKDDFTNDDSLPQHRRFADKMEDQSIRYAAYKTAWLSLEKEVRDELRTKAEAEFRDAPFVIENDAIIDATRPISMTLWDKVIERYPDVVKAELAARGIYDDS